jgi:hypothetical protein
MEKNNPSRQRDHRDSTATFISVSQPRRASTKPTKNGFCRWGQNEMLDDQRRIDVIEMGLRLFTPRSLPQFSKILSCIRRQLTSS